jgi:dTDP-4-dehydrorhamnose reductase
MKRLLVTGASGLLGLHLALQENDRYEVCGVVNRQALINPPFQAVQADLTDESAACQIIDRFKPDLMIHCAAMANIDGCEKDPARAGVVNGELPGRLARLAKEYGFQLVHISTDAVFDGTRGNYRETDPPNPLSVYAGTKLAGETRVAMENPQALIARVNFYGWSLNGNRSLAEFFFNNLKTGSRVNGFTDVYFCPLMVADLCDVLMKMAEAGLSGLYHVVSPEAITKYAFGCRIAELFGFDATLINPISVEQGGLTARRSPLLTLLPEKLQQDLSIELPDQANGLLRFYQEYEIAYPALLRELAG